ncbi:MAG TPA: 16S rRNA (cytidine(1402)-2'-O)-methyltransferase [Candidatus Paceibacterota bacterium]|nr:16S rRNA (cytidine(1402)-2'-O)-methyltransferase [Candidatus Paceibacterota bacterium]HPT40360.1 16S rRNA (cytidine(1402)-2'-O)-methyltransferase [Candidatus Paceibacterota bacterium]
MKLYIVATPIGNLQDITLRALDVLKSVDFVLCEDTRHTLKLLNHFEIKKPLISYHQHSRLQKMESIIDLLRQGKDLALVSDAGTPGVCDPGNKLIEEVLKQLPETEIIPIPGVSTLAAMLSICGINSDRFLFLGFLPIKKKRKEFLGKIIDAEYPVIFFESPYKVVKTLKEIGKLDLNLRVIVGKELTKMFERIYRGNIMEVAEKIEKDKARGEYAVIVYRN